MEGPTVTETKAALRVAAISGSLRGGSTNTGLIRAAKEICEDSIIPGLEIEHVDISDLPLLNTDLETGGGFPPAVEAFRDKVCAADCFLFASPEYNYSISGPLKNALDWGSRPPNVWADRAAAILSSSGGSGGSSIYGKLGFSWTSISSTNQKRSLIHIIPRTSSTETAV